MIDVPSALTPDQQFNKTLEKLNQLETFLQDPPDQSNPLNSSAFNSWKHRSLMKLGEIAGRISSHQESGMLDFEKGQKLKLRYYGIMSVALTKFQMGT